MRQAIHHWRAELQRGMRRDVIIVRTLSKRLHFYLRLAWSQWSLHVLRHSQAGFRRLGTCRDVWVPPDEDQHHLIAPIEWEEHERGVSGDAGECKGDQTTTLRAWWTAWSAARRVAKVHGWLWKAKGKMVRVRRQDRETCLMSTNLLCRGVSVHSVARESSKAAFY